MIAQVINILDSAIKAYKNVKKLIREQYAIFRSRRIHSAVDNHDTKSVDDIVRSIKARRKDRNDAG